jgi:outer membrane biosynthesis protein TonB
VGLAPTLLALLVTLVFAGTVSPALAQEPPAAVEPAAVEPATEPPVVEVPPVEEPVAEEPAAEEPVAEDPVVEEPVDEEPVTEEPVDETPAPVETVPDETPAEPPVGSEAEARNESIVFQIVHQVQEGCRTHCYGTTQEQDSVQRSETTQTATAEGTDAGTAENRSTTFQFVWQEQLGCVEFCFGTVQMQSASQWALTQQTATALGQAIANALNLSETLQRAWQYQESCRVECHGAVVSQELDQEAATTQESSAQTTGSDGPGGFLGWLTTLAANLGATIQTIFQHQQADCLAYCYGGAMTQEAAQEAAVDQSALAQRAAEAPPGETPPPPDPGSSSAPPDPAPAPPQPVAAAGSDPAIRPSAPAGRESERRATERLTREPRTSTQPGALAPESRPPSGPSHVPAAADDRHAGGTPAAASGGISYPLRDTLLSEWQTSDGGSGTPALALILLAAAMVFASVFFGRIRYLRMPESALRVERAPGPRRTP